MTIHLRSQFILLCAVAGLAGCNHGLRPKDVKPATSPAGVSVDLRVVGERADRVGELFAADETGVIVYTTAGRLVRVRWARLEWLEAERLHRVNFGVTRNEEVTAEKRQRLALVSRFPQGLAGQLLADVLRTLKQESLEELPPPDATPAPRSDASAEATPSLDAFAATAATAAARYADRRVAMADGYRRIGADFPAMGEHWLRTSELLEGRLDPDRPTMLTYATIEGRPTLVGTGFVVTTRDDERADHAPGWPEEWHEHSGLLAEESGARPPPSASGHTHGTEQRRGTRAWVLHIWTTLENPAGRYHADNWALPFARAGLAMRDGITVDEPAGRALALAVGGDRFLRDLLTDAGLRREANAAPVDAAIAHARTESERVLGAARAAGGANAAHLAAFRSTWRTLQEALVVSAGPAVTRYLTSGH